MYLILWKAHTQQTTSVSGGTGVLIYLKIKKEQFFNCIWNPVGNF